MKTPSEAAATGSAAKGSALPPEKAETPTRPRRRWRRRLIVMGVLLVLVVACHVPILRFLGGRLVVSDPLVPTDAVVVMGSSGPYRPVPIDEVADFYHKRLVREVLLIEDRSSRIVKAGIVWFSSAYLATGPMKVRGGGLPAAARSI